MLIGAATTDTAINWAVLLPVVTGFLAVAYLLPTPRRRSLAYGGLGVTAAVLGFGTFLWHGLGGSLPVSAETFLFAAFSILAFTFGVLMIVQRNPARAAIFFAVVVMSVCGLFLLLAAPFLTAATIIIYAGAIIVTFLFVIMLSRAPGYSDADHRSREPSLAAAVGFLMLGTLLVVLQRVYVAREADDVIARAERHANADVVDDELKKPDRAKAFLDDVVKARERLGYGRVSIPTHFNGVERRPKDSDGVEDMRRALGLDLPGDWQPTDPDQAYEPDPEEVKLAAAQIHYELSYLKAVRDGRLAPAAEGLAVSPYGLSRPAVPPDDPAKAEPHRLPNANIAALGRTLFTDHLIAIELGGTLLLVATIGAIAVAGRRREEEE